MRPLQPLQIGFDRAPSAFAVVSPSQIRGDAMVKVEGAAPFAEPELSSTTNCAATNSAEEPERKGTIDFAKPELVHHRDSRG
jgi:hypothetical protein